MESLPKLPGYSFHDPTKEKFHRSQTFVLHNGYKLPKSSFCGIGQRPLEANSIKFIGKNDVVRLDPALIYGRAKKAPAPKFLPHYALYSQKCLTFKAFTKQITPESPSETYRIKHVNMIYFLEDDTITIIEPRILNSGINQGKLVKRGKIPKDDAGNCWHWKDLAVGREYKIYGVVYHTVDCDLFTREYMASQGYIMNETELPPTDPYFEKKKLCDKNETIKSVTPKLYTKLEDVLNFKAIWESENRRKFQVLYFLIDGTVSVKEIFGKNEKSDFSEVLLKRMKLPKKWKKANACDFMSEVTEEVYGPEDMQIGQKVSIMGREMLIYDCDNFTKHFFKDALGVTLQKPIDVQEKQHISTNLKNMPPHDGFGSLEDSLQNTISFIPKPPRKDIVKQILNANKFLRYEMMMESSEPENTGRRFLLFYSLADSTCRIFEPPIRNSGIIGGKYLKATLLAKPNTDPINPEYYSPADFPIGGIIYVFKQKFKIIGADYHVYKYILANKNKFPKEVCENMRSYMQQKGFLECLEDNKMQEKKNRVEKDKDIRKQLDAQQTEIDNNLDLMELDIIVPKKQLSLNCEGYQKKYGIMKEEYDEKMFKHLAEVRAKNEDCEC